MSTMEMELSPPLPPPAPDASELRGKSTTPSSQDATDVPVTPKSHQEGEEGIVQQDGPKYPQPAYFYPHDHAVKHIPTTDYSSDVDASFGTDEASGRIRAHAWLSPEDDPMCTRGIPVFQPTMEEFEDFEAYQESILPWGQIAGIVKIIPPKEWSESLPSLTPEALANVRIKSPIQQNMIGRSGIFMCRNIEKKKALTMKEWFDKCQQKVFKGPGPNDISLTEKREQEAKNSSPAKRRRTKKESQIVAQDDGAKQDGKGDVEADGQDEEANKDASEDASQHRRTASTSSGSRPEVVQNIDQAEDKKVDPFYEEFDPMSKWLPDGTKAEDYTVETCKEMERKYWRGLSLGEPSWYGADLKGSLFTDETTAWNVAHLPNLLNRLKRKLPGVNTPYLYFGMWAATFAWHVEDMDLFSINYIHFGAPKFWYAIPPKKSDMFERVMAGHFPSDARHCNQFLRHKSFAVSPQRLANDVCRPNVLVQKQGEFVITYPRGYHMGFNMGFNCAESINFALSSWVELGRIAKYCQCEGDTVRIDIDEEMRQSALAEAMQTAKEERQRQRELRKTQPQSVRRKRQRADGDGTPKKRPRKQVEVVMPTQSLPLPPPEPVRPCVFCPSTQQKELLPLHDTQGIANGYFKGATQPQSHLACARSIPEVWIEEVGAVGLVVFGIEDIPKDRWKLKCSSCTDPKLQRMGAKVQCTKGKCPRAFHVTCAIHNPDVSFSEYEVDEWVPVPMAEGQTVPRYELAKTLRTELLCPQHNPAVKEARKQQAKMAFRNKILSLPPGSRIRVRFPSGQTEVSLARVFDVEEMAEVMTDDGRPHLVRWNIIVLEPKQGSMATVSNDYSLDRNHSSTSQNRAEKYAQRQDSSSTPTARSTASAYGAAHAILQPSANPAPSPSDFVQAFQAAVIQSGQDAPLRSYADGVGVDFSKISLTPALWSLLASNPLLRNVIGHLRDPRHSV